MKPRTYEKGIADYHFCEQPVEANGRSSAGATALNIENGKVVNAVYKHYDNIFRAYYNKTPDMDDTNIATVLNDCMGLVDVAEALGSIACISESVDIALLRHGQILFRSIATNPIAWSDLACRVRSPSIFKEVLIHLVGDWDRLTEEQRATIRTDVRELCKTKHEQLKLTKMAIEVRILGHYPTSVQRSVEQAVGRMSYQNNIYMWMVISLFRHWFSQSMAEQRNLMSKDGGALFYRQLAAGGQAYLDRKAMEGFHQYFPMSAKGAAVFTNHMTKYKDELRHFVADLVVNHAQLDTDKHPLPYLTCLQVDREDLPWINAKPVEEISCEKRYRRDRLLKQLAVAEDDNEQNQGNADTEMSGGLGSGGA